MKSKIRIIAIIFTVILIVIVFYTYPRQINKSLEGIVYRNGSENNNYEEKVDIKINGTLRYNLLGNKVFKGAIKINGKDTFKFNGEQLNIVFLPLLGANVGELHHFYSDIFVYGYIYINGEFDQLTIQKVEKYSNGEVGWKVENGLMISAPATNRNEAVRISNEILKGFTYILE